MRVRPGLVLLPGLLALVACQAHPPAATQVPLPASRLAATAAAAPPAPAAGYRDGWRGAADWLVSVAQAAPPGMAWAADPRDPTTVSNGLYSGYAGVVLFLLAAGKEAGEPRYLEAGRAGADHLLAQVDAETEPGLYTGLAGMSYTLEAASRATGDRRYHDGARRAAERIIALARRAGTGVEWGPDPPSADQPPSNDVVGGSAGIGLFLLWAGPSLDLPAALPTATAAGHHLLEVALPAPPDGRGRKWLWMPGFERVYPNFAHGTAGVGYFLATLYEQTHEQAFLDGAVAAARYLQAVATCDGDSCLIFRHEPDARDLYYYSWCHGPAGTARLFYRLSRVTGDASYMAYAESLARGVLDSGIPETPRPGFWNVSQCCGSAGLGEFFLALHRVTGRLEYRDFARRMSDDLLARATHDGSGWRWVQAENRTEPDKVVAQTGYMQGAAGIGLWLLRWDAFGRGEAVDLTLPDSPF